MSERYFNALKTDDPADPCPYCIQVKCDICGWDCQDDNEHCVEHWVAMAGPNRVAERVYDGIHERCAANLAAYEAEVRADEATRQAMIDAGVWA